MRKYEEEKLHPIRKTLELYISEYQSFISLVDNSVIPPVEMKSVYNSQHEKIGEEQHMPEKEIYVEKDIQITEKPYVGSNPHTDTLVIDNTFNVLGNILS